MTRLTIIAPVSVFLMFVLLFDCFKSVSDALLIILNVPMALIGGIVALYITGIPLSVSAAVGFIALFGIAVLDGVVLLSFIRQWRPIQKIRLSASAQQQSSQSISGPLASNHRLQGGGTMVKDLGSSYPLN